MVFRVYVEKRPEYAVEAQGLLQEFKTLLGAEGLSRVRVLNRYDVEGVDEALFQTAVETVLSEPPLDEIYTELPSAPQLFAVAYLPGQFDQRADSAAECIQLISQGERPLVQAARVYLLEGEVSEAELLAIKGYVINPVEAQEVGLEPKPSLRENWPAPPDVPVLEDFLELDGKAMAGFIARYALAMDEADLAFCQAHFKKEGRAPSLTELRVIDTYWSDHCRHTTFGTCLETVEIEDAAVQKSYEKYLELRGQLYGSESKRPRTLMDMATIGAKALKAAGRLPAVDESEEINACSVKIRAKIGGGEEDWLLLFKNETHNHPTEIEPFGGAATCIGGAIRDPLAGRGYVFGAMRVTGASSPLAPVADTLPGKLPQRKLCQTAAAGFASYGNQIGLATGQVTELYHPGYAAKRMELGAVLGAVPQSAVRRCTPKAGDVVLLVGGATGRDGCGGATGSSKAHGTGSLATCGAEVQKGNAPMERRLQRLFKNPDATRMIRRCNDFGAGGVCVAIGELAEGLEVDLDAVPKKYDGLDGTELAISESQERMAVVVDKADAEAFIAFAAAENLQATPVARVTEDKRLVMYWRGARVVDLDRAFISSNGAVKRAGVRVPPLPQPVVYPPEGNTLEEQLYSMAADLRFCSQQGLGERFDSTIGAASVLMPYGGRYQATPGQALAMKLPVEDECDTCAGMAFGFDAFITQQNPYAGAYLAVVDSVAKLAAAGFELKDMHLSLQEYFERLRNEPARWGKPFAALLGALQAQLDLGVAAIGGKDSMSGSFEDLDVPPTLVSFAVAAGSVGDVNCGEFQLPQSRVVLLRPASGDGLVPNPAAFKLVLAQLRRLMDQNLVLSVRAVGAGGLAEALFKMCLGNRVGFELSDEIDPGRLFAPGFGQFVVELEGEVPAGEFLGNTTGTYVFKAGEEQVALEGVQAVWEAALEPVFPRRLPTEGGEVPAISYQQPEEQRRGPKIGTARPRALVPVFPGTNCEYDTARALRRAGAEADIFVVCNRSPAQVAESAQEMARRLAQSQMLVVPGGFSAGDEPEGSAKLICAFLRTPQVAQALMALLRQRDGLALGICNGFQALLKLGLLTHGEIRPQAPDDPTLSFNTIGRHQSMLARTRIASNLSPWLWKEPVGAVHTLAVSHGEGRFVANNGWLERLKAAGQIAAQYVDMAGEPSLDVRYNPPGSTLAIEAVCSPDGRVLGKMGHTERRSEGVYKNVPGNTVQLLFESGVDYFR